MPLAVSIANRVCVAFLCGRAGRLTAKRGNFRRGQLGRENGHCLPDDACHTQPISDAFENAHTPGLECYPHYLGGDCCPASHEHDDAYAHLEQLENGGNLPKLVSAVKAGKCAPCELDENNEPTSGCDFGAGTCSRQETFGLGGDGWAPTGGPNSSVSREDWEEEGCEMPDDDELLEYTNFESVLKVPRDALFTIAFITVMRC